MDNQSEFGLEEMDNCRVEQVFFAPIVSKIKFSRRVIFTISLLPRSTVPTGK